MTANEHLMIFSPFAHRHHQVITALLFISFHSISPLRQRFSHWIILFYFLFLISNRMPGFDFQYVLPWYFILVFFSHSECRLSFSSKGNINYIVFFSCSSCATKYTYSFNTHILNSLRSVLTATRTIMYSRMQRQVKREKEGKKRSGRTSEDGEKLPAHCACWIKK